TVQYLQSNYLGSVVGITDASGTLVDTMRYSPWGEQRNLTMSETTLNYTGQHRDNTALIYDHARSYNPAWGRFMSPDSVVPGTTGGSGGAAETIGSGATTPLMVDFHESGFVGQLNQHNAATGSMGFWFQLSDEERKKAESPMGPVNPQALNRYSYALNNPLRYTDPTGHFQEIGADGEGSEGTGGLPPDIVEGGDGGVGSGEPEGTTEVKPAQPESPPTLTEAEIKSELSQLSQGSQREGRNVVTIGSDADLRQLFNELSRGGTPIQTRYPGQMVELQDGTRVGLRSDSSSGGATIDVFFTDGTQTKVHIK
ncbi:MAG: RHS repeat-associated core domain-containing protein, partial [Herpetosiphonaceae bacterium]|nr:RHS repeat-associated core domain-containing protein [Herpetosiphonaceae bacterium]